jgi:hypothetical protein
VQNAVLQVPTILSGDLREMLRIPTGCLLIHMSVFET